MFITTVLDVKARCASLFHESLFQVLHSKMQIVRYLLRETQSYTIKMCITARFLAVYLDVVYFV
jgi:hypothetical protein